LVKNLTKPLYFLKYICLYLTIPPEKCKVWRESSLFNKVVGKSASFIAWRALLLPGGRLFLPEGVLPFYVKMYIYTKTRKKPPIIRVFGAIPRGFLGLFS